MKPAIKQKWVKALMSGDYLQGRERLITADGKYCCIGVLHKVVLGCEPPDLYEDQEGGAAPLGITDEMTTEFAYMNDDGVPFEVIAGFIQENL